ncbi:MAG: hypothetical protein WC989_02940 [Micavibrio sp.]
MSKKKTLWKRRALGAVFMGVAAVDLYGYAGEYGERLLRTNSVTEQAAPFYKGFGVVLNFGWRSLKDLAGGINDIAQRHYRP